MGLLGERLKRFSPEAIMTKLGGKSLIYQGKGGKRSRWVGSAAREEKECPEKVSKSRNEPSNRKKIVIRRKGNLSQLKKSGPA